MVGPECDFFQHLMLLKLRDLLIIV
jgi:hypothetical protein